MSAQCALTLASNLPTTVERIASDLLYNNKLASVSLCPHRKVRWEFRNPISWNCIGFGLNGLRDGGFCHHKSPRGEECMCAERNAVSQIIRKGEPLRGKIGLGNLSPCSKCADVLIKERVAGVIFDDIYEKDLAGLYRLAEAGIRVWYFTKGVLWELPNSRELI